MTSFYAAPARPAKCQPLSWMLRADAFPVEYSLPERLLELLRQLK